MGVGPSYTSTIEVTPARSNWDSHRKDIDPPLRRWLVSFVSARYKVDDVEMISVFDLAGQQN